MVIDGSALMAILRREPEEQDFRNTIKLASSRLLSASTRVETGIVALGRAGEAGLEPMQALLEENPEWDAAERRPDMNHFMARLIFCFFAEDTDIFHRSYPLTGTVETMSEHESSNTHEVIGDLFPGTGIQDNLADKAKTMGIPLFDFRMGGGASAPFPLST